jgi:hypothetical protein
MTSRLLLFSSLFLISTFPLFAQNVPTRLEYDGVLWSKNDTFYVQGSNWEKPAAFATTQGDTIDLGTDGIPGLSIRVWTTSDTLTVPYVNSPFEQWLFIKVASDKGRTVYRLRFNEQTADYSDQYVKDNKGKIAFTVPETYELANIILYLSVCSQKTYNHPGKFDYADQVTQWFAPFKNHKLIQILDKKCNEKEYFTTYYGFRENSICFSFNGNALNLNTPYKMAYWDNADMMAGEFRSLLYLVQDFANKSRFKEFYAAHKAYYDKLEKRQAELLPVTQMWKWLEKEFPERMDAYKIVFSPLIGGSHSTQKFHKGFYEKPEFRECLMFINAPEAIDAQKDMPEKLKQGMMSGIVFTEIDHNYVNPASDQAIKEIKSLISNKNFWATEEEQKHYQSEYAIFNEYMTHSVFCLYITETYEPDLAQKIIDNRIGLMKRRGYIKFSEFNEILLRLMKDRKSTVYQSYKQLIEAMKSIR